MNFRSTTLTAFFSSVLRWYCSLTFKDYLSISSVNVTKFTVTFTEEILNGKLYFLCSECLFHRLLSTIYWQQKQHQMSLNVIDFFFDLIMQLILINCNNADNVYFCGFLLLVQKKLFNRSLEGVFLTFVRSIYLSIYLSYIIYIYCIYIIHL